jgi:hypothetical protein
LLYNSVVSFVRNFSIKLHTENLNTQITKHQQSFSRLNVICFGVSCQLRMKPNISCQFQIAVLLFDCYRLRYFVSCHFQLSLSDVLWEFSQKQASKMSVGPRCLYTVNGPSNGVTINEHQNWSILLGTEMCSENTAKNTAHKTFRIIPQL